MIRWHVVSAVFWRNVKQYFSGPLGYLFIVVFVTICAVMAFSPQFFADNQATLDQLSRWFPMLLLFFVPAITMSVWADEKRQGTDSILFTLPASDLDILLGKYFSVVAVYTIALLFSLTQVGVLEVLGDPDWGVLAATYIGYWWAGVALLSVGMFASSLTGSATVAFVLGALFCAVPVLLGQYFRGFVGIERFGFDWNLRDFTLGLVPLSNVVYFVALTILMLYLNLIVISKRHWSRGQQVSIGGQFAIRAISLAVVLVSLGYLSSTAVSSIWSRVDLTHEKLYTLDPATVSTLDIAKSNDREVTIQAYVSKDVPRKFVNVKKQFVGLLRQYSEYGGKNVTVRFVDVEPASEAAIEAKQAGIEPIEDRSEVGGRLVEQDVFLGATVSSSLGDVTLPVVTEDSAIEYELSRAIATTVDKDNIISLGILETDPFFGGPEIDGRRIEDQWLFSPTMTELKKQFKIVHIKQEQLQNYVPSDTDPAQAELLEKDRKVKTPPDVLLVPDPSSLDDQTMRDLVKYVKSGNPTILLTDPLPFYWPFQHPTIVGVINAPNQPRVSQRSQYARVFSSSLLPKSDNGTAAKIMNAIGVDWDNGTAVWNDNNPHPKFLPVIPGPGAQSKEYYGPIDRALVFVTDQGDQEAFNNDSLITQGLNELLMFYPGAISKSSDSPYEFTPLVSIGKNSGATPWRALTETPELERPVPDPRTGRIRIEKQAARSNFTNEDLIVIKPDPKTYQDDKDYVVAAQITGDENNKMNVVVITDLDFLADVYYTQQEALEKKLDNLALLQNSIEILAGNDAFVSLRNRSATPRTLKLMEAISQQFRKKTTVEQEKAEKEMQEQLAAEQQKLDSASQEIQSNQSLGFFEKLQRTSQEASEAQRRFELKKRRLDRDLEVTKTELQSNQQRSISAVENRTRYFSIFSAPLPALLLGVMVLWYRKLNEIKDISADRRV